MEIKGYSYIVEPGKSEANTKRLFNLQETSGFPVIKAFLIPEKPEYHQIFVTLKNVSTSHIYMVDVPLSSLRQNYLIPVNLPMGEYSLQFESKNLVNVNVDFSGLVEFTK